MGETVRTEIAGAIATLTLNRPKELNALNDMMVEDLRRAAYKVENDTNVRCVVIKGEGDHFMAGGDIFLFREWLDLPAEELNLNLDRLLGDVHRTIQSFRRMPKPVIASVRGASAGFGLSLMMAADLAIAADNSVFTLAYCNIGTTPDGSSTYSLPRMVGMKRAMELALLGDRFDAETAERYGLVNRVVPLDQLDAETAKLAQRLAAGPTTALGRTKALINSSLNNDLADQLRAEEENFASSARTSDFSEGVRAFTEKRKPAFTGK
ncbi:MAG: enoyl-CoA hydratase [Rhodospirillales bacterium]|nr:enoyl-CoA hydratase [Rhodospirillales bacterium]MCW8861337.1 enoyl-CoA hydratase [Rhodospirillales bacterium]